MGKYNWFLILMLINVCSGQIVPGAESAALSNSDAAVTGHVFALFKNPAGTEKIKGIDAGIFYSPAPFGMKELSNGFAAISVGLNYLRLSAGYSFYGFDLYRENSFYLGVSKTFYDNLSIGAAFSVTNISIKNYGSTSVMKINCGMIYSISDLTSFAFSIQNMTSAKVKNDNKPLPVIYDFGISFHPEDDFTVNIAAEKEIYFDTSYRLGVEYRLFNFFALRAGTSTQPDTFSGGVGIRYSFINLSYAFRQHNILGMTHNIDLIFKLTDE